MLFLFFTNVVYMHCRVCKVCSKVAADLDEARGRAVAVPLLFSSLTSVMSSTNTSMSPIGLTDQPLTGAPRVRGKAATNNWPSWIFFSKGAYFQAILTEYLASS